MLYIYVYLFHSILGNHGNCVHRLRIIKLLRLPQFSLLLSNIQKFFLAVISPELIMFIINCELRFPRAGKINFKL